MTKGCKSWLWFIFITNTLGLLSSLNDLAVFQQAGMGGLGLLLLVPPAIAVVGIAVMLFFQQKYGFYILVVAIIYSFIRDLKLGADVAYEAGRAIAALVQIGITYYFISKSKDVIN